MVTENLLAGNTLHQQAIIGHTATLERICATPIEKNHCVVVKVKTSDRENPVLDTVSDIWRTAEFHEMEVFDFFGIRFNDHPNMKRLFLPPEWEGYPLRKDYEDEVNMVIK